MYVYRRIHSHNDLDLHVHVSDVAIGRVRVRVLSNLIFFDFTMFLYADRTRFIDQITWLVSQVHRLCQRLVFGSSLVTTTTLIDFLLDRDRNGSGTPNMYMYICRRPYIGLSG
jgi:hypothetical protein